jgi:hypothetical protein
MLQSYQCIVEGIKTILFYHSVKAQQNSSSDCTAFLNRLIHPKHNRTLLFITCSSAGNKNPRKISI